MKPIKIMKHLYILFFLTITNLAFAQPVNDNCSNAEPITVSSEVTTVNFNTTNASLNNEIGCDGNVTTYADVWYSFTMPFDGNVVIDGSLFWNNIGATNACNGNLLACGSAELTLTNISANTNVLIRIFRNFTYYQNPQFQSFSIQAFETPTNDTCDNSINIPLGILQTQVPFEIGGSVANSGKGCSNTTLDYADVWYDFTMPFDGNLFLDGNTIWNKFELYDACSGTSLFCGEDTLLAVGLTDNTDYKIRVYRSVEDMFTPTFLNFNILAYQATINDSCNNAIPLNPTETLTAVTTPFIGGSSIENTTGCTNDVKDYLDIWYSFTMLEEGNINITSGTVWNLFELYNDCNGSPISCFSQNGAFNTLPIGTYYLRVFRELAFATSPVSKDFNISSTAKTLSTDSIQLDSASIFPNPALDYLSVQSPLKIEEIEILDLNGKLLLSTKLTKNIPISFLQKGSYIIKLFSNDIYTSKLWVKK